MEEAMQSVYEDSRYRNKGDVFLNRTEAGHKLATRLEPDYGELPDGIVLAIPSGGVPIGIVLSRMLDLEFDLVIVRKIQIPGNTEAGFGALASGGKVFFNRELMTSLQLTQDQIDEQINKVREELRLRNTLFRQDQPFPDLKGKTVIITDDGLASGFTMIAAIDAVRQNGAEKVVVAVPTGPMSSIRRVKPHADAVYCLNIKDVRYFAVADAYLHWRDLTREEVIEMMQEKDKKSVV